MKCCYYNNFKSEQTEVLKGDDDDPRLHVIFFSLFKCLIKCVTSELAFFHLSLNIARIFLFKI